MNDTDVAARLAEALRRDSRYWAAHDRVWLVIVILASGTGLWFGARPGAVPLLAALCSWVLAVTWLAAGRGFCRARAAALRGEAGR